MKYVKFLLIALLISCIRNVFCAKLQEKFRWKEVSYAWPNEAAKEDAIKTGRYQPENNLPLGLEVWKDKLFITVPRYNNNICNYSHFFVRPFFITKIAFRKNSLFIITKIFYKVKDFVNAIFGLTFLWWSFWAAIFFPKGNYDQI